MFEWRIGLFPKYFTPPSRQPVHSTLHFPRSQLHNHLFSRPRCQIRNYYYRRPSAKAPNLYCEVDAESLCSYRKGGFHPTHLGDHLKDGRYKIIHKLGFGGFSTLWLARDLLLKRLVALKIRVSERLHDDNEIRILERLSQWSTSQVGMKHMTQLLDHFEHTGPNGTHQCLVLEVVGPSTQSAATLYPSARLPGYIAWKVVRQLVQTFSYLHARGIAHGDIHTHNICFANPLNSHQSDAEVIKSLGTPRRADVDAKYGFPLTPSIPSYIVEPTSFPNLMLTPGSCQIKLVDFGAAVSQSEKPRGTCCCMDFRAPEDVLKDQKDVRSDIWSLGCTIFELIVGYPLFDTWPQNSNADLIREWIPVLGDLPAEWNVEPPMITEISDPSEPTTLSALLQNGYFEQEIDEDTGERYETFYGRDETPYFSTADIRSIASLLRSMLHYRPEDRLSVEEVGSHPWLRRPPGLK